MRHFHVRTFSSLGGSSHLALDERERPLILDGFPFMEERATRKTIEPVLDFLMDRHGSPKMLADGTWSPDTVKAAAFDLRLVFEVAHELDMGHLEIDGEFLDHYRAYAAQRRNAKNKLNSPGYVNRQVQTAFDYALFCHERGYRTDDPGDLDLSGVGCSPRELGERSSNNLLRRPPRAMLPHEIRQLIPHLGKLPSERAPSDPSARLRLADQFGKVIGVRADEVVGILAPRITAMRAAVESDPGGSSPLLLDKTKGLVEREVPLPHFLAREALIYHDGERAKAVAAGRRFWLGDGPEPTTLLLNGVGAGRDAGRAFARELLELEFHRAVVAADLLKPDRQLDENYRPILVMVARFSFHSNRHTHAIQLWIRRLLAGDRHPENAVQARLGHRDPSTTKSRYLTAVKAFQTMVGDGLDDFFRMLNNGQR